MKYLIFPLFLISITVHGQLKTVDMDYTGIYQVVVDTEKDDLYNLTNKWIGKTYNSAKTVIESQIENEYIKLRGLTVGEFGIPQIDYSLEFDFKPNRCRITYTVDKLTVQTTTFEYSGYFKKDGTLREANVNKKKRVDEKIQLLLNSYYDFLFNDGKDDW